MVGIVFAIITSVNQTKYAKYDCNIAAEQFFFLIESDRTKETSQKKTKYCN